MKTIQYKFVQLIPDILEEGVLYISIEYCTAIHKCACGCGNEVVTPFSPKDWELTFDGNTVSLSPSIGNWNFDCQSHYWIKRSEIRLANKGYDTKNMNDTKEVTDKRKKPLKGKRGVVGSLVETLQNVYKSYKF